jgi:putative hydrolase of HD superfamily
MPSEQPSPEELSPEVADDRLDRQIRFVLEIDRLKRVQRRTVLTDRSRRENSAEHSWHISLMALLLSEYSMEDGIDLFRVVKMLLIHDIVEIDAGDTFVYDEDGLEDKDERERAAADRLFGLLPPDQRDDLHALWREFETRETPEARFAAALDRLQPVLQNVHTEGASWREHGIRHEQVVSFNHTMGEGAPELWRLARRLLDEAVAKGHLEG